jgi:hypothetical protein
MSPRRNWDSPNPASVPLPLEMGGGHTRLRVRAWGSPNSDDWRQSLALCLLCAGYLTGELISLITNFLGIGLKEPEMGCGELA